jgi:hypothetical protein
MEPNTDPSSVPAPFVKRRLRNFVIDKRFQLGWVVRVAFTTALILGAMGYFLFTKLKESTEMMIAQTLAVDGLTPDAQKRIIEKGQTDEWVAVCALAIGLFGILLLLSVMTIVATHKIAGPAVKIRKLLARIDGEHLQLWGKLRKGDELHETFRDMEEMLRRLREARHRDIEELETIAAALRSASKDADAAAQIERVAARFRESIEMR